MTSALAFRPVDAGRWADFEALFEAPGGPKYCWCMVWRVDATERRQTKGRERKPMMKRLVMANTPVGLLAYEHDKPVAWVSVAPRDTYNRLGGPQAEPGAVVWSLVCMFIPRARRGEGLAHCLIAAAIEHATAEGATTLEAYPVDPASPSYRFMGLVPAIEQAGFEFVHMAGTRRHVMRLGLR